MLHRILEQMNLSIQSNDEPFTIEDAKQHVNDYNAWSDGKLHICDCGIQHDRETFLNANSGNWLCRECVQAIDDAEQKRRDQKLAQLELELRRFQEARHEL